MCTVMRHVWDKSFCAVQRGEKKGWAVIRHRWRKISGNGGKPRPAFGFFAWLRFKTIVKVWMERNSFLGDQGLLQTMELFFSYCKCTKDKMKVFLGSDGKIAPSLSFISAQISGLGCCAICNFDLLCCATKYLTSAAGLERWLKLTQLVKWFVSKV